MAYQSILNPMPITGALTDTQIRASALPVSLASTTITGTVTITAAALPLPAGAATDGVLTGGTARTIITDGTNNAGLATGSIAASELLLDRLKVNASLRVLDMKQPAGSRLVAALGDQTTGLLVNVKAHPTSTIADVSLPEQMTALVAAQYATVNLLAEILANLRGRPGPLPGDEGDALIREYLDPRNIASALN